MSSQDDLIKGNSVSNKEANTWYLHTVTPIPVTGNELDTTQSKLEQPKNANKKVNEILDKMQDNVDTLMKSLAEGGRIE